MSTQLLESAYRSRTGNAPGFFARQVIASVLAGGMMFGASAALADGPPKAKRPSLCVRGTPVSGDGVSGYMCLDGKRPRFFARFVVVRFVNESGRATSYVLGWPARAEEPVRTTVSSL